MFQFSFVPTYALHPFIQLPFCNVVTELRYTINFSFSEIFDAVATQAHLQELLVNLKEDTTDFYSLQELSTQLEDQIINWKVSNS